MQEFQNSYGINSQKMSISLDILKHGGIRNATISSTSTNSSSQSRTKRILRKSTKRPNIFFKKKNSRNHI